MRIGDLVAAFRDKVTWERSDSIRGSIVDFSLKGKAISDRLQVK